MLKIYKKIFFVFFLCALIFTTTANAASDAENAKKLNDADKLLRGYYYDEALELVRTLSETDETKNKITAIENAQKSLEKYTGDIHHIFFHSLIVYPELAFDNKGHPANGYNMWMATVSEFQKILPILKERGYVLYNLTDFIESDDILPEKPASSDKPEKTTKTTKPAKPKLSEIEQKLKIKPKDIYLPLGKIPLVISIDDVSYYEYMKKDGFANCLVLSDDGRVWARVTTPEGETVLTRDGDLMPILDDYVDENPEFSWRGAKGTIALTGYQGALGYKIMSSQTDEENARASDDAKPVADALKANGWLFACHSYGHSAFFRNGSLTLDKLRKDTAKWKKIIEPIVGATNIYISPFGVNVIFEPKSAYSKYLVEQGFNIMCPVGARRDIYKHGTYIVMPRMNIDGYKMIKGKSVLQKYYFDPDEVLDPARPALK